MKEATGDLNMTVVVVILVAVLVAFFSMYIGPMIIKNIKSDTNCADAICNCKFNELENGMCKCRYKYKSNGGTEYKTVYCPYKG